MRLEKASLKAINYSCKNFHYSKSVPVNPFAFSVFNDSNEWCGCILYSVGANNNIGKSYKLCGGQIIELTRMALNGKQESTSKALSLSIKLMAKKNPLIKMIVSYADSEQGHTGTIYKATNWYFIGVSKCIHHIHKTTGKRMHNRVYSELPKNKQAEYKNTIPFEKYKYIYPLDKSLIPLCKSLAKPYPKHAALPHKGEGQAFQLEGAFDSTVPLKTPNHAI
jgi:hypothetical protein